MKRLFTITGVMLLLMGSATAFAENPKGCGLLGTYMGYDQITENASWMSTAHGQSSSKGTYILEFPGFDSSLFGFPGAVMGATLMGMWTRTDGYTFAVTVVGLGVDSLDGSTLYIGKLNATDTFKNEDCSKMWIEATLELFAPYQDPFGEDPPLYGTIPLYPHWGYRMSGEPFNK